MVIHILFWDRPHSLVHFLDRPVCGPSIFRPSDRYFGIFVKGLWAKLGLKGQTNVYQEDSETEMAEFLENRKNRHKWEIDFKEWFLIGAFNSSSDWFVNMKPKLSCNL